MKAHLLYEAQDFNFGAPLAPQSEGLIQDLELNILLEAMAGGDRLVFEVSRQVMLTVLDDPDLIRYRQEVLADCLAHPEIIREIYAIAVGALDDKRLLWTLTSRYPASVLAGAVRQFESFVIRLKQLRKVADEHEDAFRSKGIRTLLRTLEEELDEDYFETINDHLRQLKFKNGPLISMRLGRDNSGVDYVLRSPGVAKAGWRERLRLAQRRAYSFTIPPRDEAGADALSDMTSRGINMVANAAAQSADHITSYFTMLRAELAFYVGCINLNERLSAAGEQIAVPEPLVADVQAMSCSNLRDVCLSLKAPGPVVGNEMAADSSPLIIVTGANSGGKSTFLRSIGLAQLMMQCGMFVAASAYRSSVSSAVFSHFIRQEDSSMVRGRLDEELARMSTIADELRPYSLMLFNESFSATNEREGSEIARQVIRALLEAKVRVVFVTHQYDFAQSFQGLGGPPTVFLRAPRDDGRGTRFKLEVAEPLPTSFGEDLYHRLGGWFDPPGDRADDARLAAGS